VSESAGLETMVPFEAHFRSPQQTLTLRTVNELEQSERRALDDLFKQTKVVGVELCMSKQCLYHTNIHPIFGKTIGVKCNS